MFVDIAEKKWENCVREKMAKKRKNKIPVVREEEIAETNNRTRDDSDIVRWSHIGYFLKYTMIV